VKIDGLVMDRLVNGKVQERWEQFDNAALMQQLGLVPG
jgi:predicted ester cyclase